MLKIILLFPRNCFLSCFWLQIKLFWHIQDFFIFSNNDNFVWSSDLSRIGPHKDHSSQAWFKLAEKFQRRRFLMHFSYFAKIGKYVGLMKKPGIVLKNFHYPLTIIHLDVSTSSTAVLAHLKCSNFSNISDIG